MCGFSLCFVIYGRRRPLLELALLPFCFAVIYDSYFPLSTEGSPFCTDNIEHHKSMQNNHIIITTTVPIVSPRATVNRIFLNIFIISSRDKNSYMHVKSSENTQRKVEYTSIQQKMKQKSKNGKITSALLTVMQRKRQLHCQLHLCNTVYSRLTVELIPFSSKHMKY